MKNGRFYFTAILLLYILVYFFKFYQDLFAFQEYICLPNQTYTEQLFSKQVSYFRSTISAIVHYSEPLSDENNRVNYIPIWRSILLTYNSKVLNRLKLYAFFAIPTIRFILVFHKKNICQKSSIEEVLYYRFFNNDLIQFNT